FLRDNIVPHLYEHSTDLSSSKSVENSLLSHLCECREQGQLVLLFDALDQAAGNDKAVQVLRGLIYDQRYDHCRIVLCSRPHALDGYWDNFFQDAPIPWRFVQLDEFDVEQQRRYLGEYGEHLDLIPPETRHILSVPRVLFYLRRLPPHELQQIETPSDLY